MDFVRFVQFAVVIYQGGYLFCLGVTLPILLMLSYRNLLLVPLERALSGISNKLFGGD